MLSKQRRRCLENKRKAQEGKVGAIEEEDHQVVETNGKLIGKKPVVYITRNNLPKVMIPLESEDPI